MRLVYTREQFDPQGIPLPNVPVLLNDDLSIVELPQRWLFRLALHSGRSRSPQTWRSYAEALYDWLQTCSTNGWDWASATEAEVESYRNQMLYYPSSVTGRPLAITTINGRLRRIAMFYAWAYRFGHLEATPFTYDDVRVAANADGRLLAHVLNERHRVALDLTLREQLTIPIALTIEQVRQIRQHLSERDALATDWALTTGARRGEVLGLTINDIPESHRTGPTGRVGIRIVGKGRRRRDLLVPLRLIDRTNWYIDEVRRPLLARLGLSRDTEPSALFLSDRGRPLAPRTLYHHFRTAARKAGSPATFHSLRHTFAIFTLAELTRRNRDHQDGGVNALKTLQLLLGHASLQTTQIYLSALRLEDTSVASAIDDLYDAVMER